jgi:lambda family phage portal protein
LLDPLLLDPGHHEDLPDGRRIRMGIEIDVNGKPLAYHLANGAKPNLTPFLCAGLTGEKTRIPADQIIHRFLREQAAQLRGYPWIAPSGRRLWLIKDFEEAAAVASSNAAKRVGFFVSPTGEAPPGMADQIVSSVLDQAKATGKILSAEEVQALVAVAEKFTTTAPGQFDTLPTGYDFRPFQSEYPHVEHGQYIKAALRGISAGLGVSYVSMGNDLESVNYSSARVGILGEREYFKRLQAMLIKDIHTDIFADWLKAALLAAPALARVDPARYDQYIAAATWQPRRWAGIDPLKEAAAAEKNLALRLTSRRRLILERGEDPEEVFAEIASEEQQFGPLVPNPAAAPAPQDDKDDEEEKPAARRARLMRVRTLGE